MKRTAARTLLWLEGRQLRWALPITLLIATSAALLTRSFSLENGTLGPNVCGHIWRQGGPVTLPIDFAGNWFGQLGALILPGIATWMGSRVRTDEAFLALAPISSLQAVSARLVSGVMTLTLAVIVTSTILALSGLQPVSWWPREDLWLLFLSASGLLWLRSVTFLAITALLRQWLGPVPTLLAGLVLNLGTVTLWTGLARRTLSGSGPVQSALSDPFIFHLQAGYDLQRFSPGLTSEADCQIIQEFFNRTLPDALPQVSIILFIPTILLAPLIILVYLSRQGKRERA